jgi:hypothetical protein
MRLLQVLAIILLTVLAYKSHLRLKKFREVFSSVDKAFGIADEPADNLHTFVAPVNRTGFGLRGKHWLKENLKLVLTASRPAIIDGLGNYELRIFPISKNMTCNASKLDLYVRISGPEIMAGSAIPSIKDCLWTFSFHLDRPGEYIVESKILVYNGQADVHPNAFNYSNVNITDKDLPLNLRHVYFNGRKLYSPYTGCAEVCTRVPRCVSWAYPTRIASSGCELFFDDQDLSNSTVIRLLSHVSQHDKDRRKLIEVMGHQSAFGKPRAEETAYFLGCGWSFWLSDDFPCENPKTDDLITNFTFVFSRDSAQDKAPLLSKPLCTAADETSDTRSGRWVRQPYPNETECPDNTLLSGKDFQVSILKYDGEHHNCWYRENLSIIGTLCLERGCQSAKNNESVTWLHDETQFYGTWEPYKCRYMELTTHELQQCIITKNISTIKVTGSSISNIVRDYLTIRMADIQFVNATDSTVVVEMSTHSFPHLLWHNSMEEIAEKLNALPESTVKEPRYWISSVYISSEREDFVHNGRAVMFNKIAEPIFAKKGYTQLNIYDMGAAFAFDSTGQLDGLHLLGLPMKMLITKFLSHLCSDVVS